MVITVSHSYRRVRKERLTLQPAGLNVEMRCGIDVSVLLDLDTVQLWNYRRARGFPTRHRTTNNENYKQCRTAVHSHQLSWVKCHLTAIAHFRLTTRLSLIVSGNLCVQWNGSNLTEAWAEGGERELNIPTNCNITGLNGLLLNGEWCISILKWMWLVWAPRRSKLLSSSHSSPRDWWSLLSASLLTACDNPDSQPIMMTSTTRGRVYFFRPS